MQGKSETGDAPGVEAALSGLTIVDQKPVDRDNFEVEGGRGKDGRGVAATFYVIPHGLSGSQRTMSPCPTVVLPSPSLAGMLATVSQDC